MQDKECRNCSFGYCTLRESLQMNLNCGSRIKTNVYIDVANRCQDYKK
jgi:hypothetical protein